MIHAVIFDMDGVLVDSEPVYYQRQIEYMRSVGVTPATTNIQDYAGYPGDQVWAHVIPDPGLRKQVRSGFEQGIATQPIDYGTIVIPGVQELLQHLHKHGYQTALASAGPLPSIKTMFAQTGLGRYFDSVISGETVSRNKPDPQVYLESLAKLNVPATAALAIEDSKTGIAAAKNAGMQVWALQPRAYTLDQSTADYVAADMQAILLRLRQLEREG
mgnify:CR=1 FL=1